MSRHNYTKTSTSSTGGGLGVFGILQIIFIVLKVLKVISWSWWAVFIPTFISLGITLLVVLTSIVICSIERKRG